MTENGKGGKEAHLGGGDIETPPGGSGARKSCAVESKGCLCVNSNPPEAEIWLDGNKVAGLTPAHLENIDPGSHTVGVFLPGAPPASTVVKVVAGSIVPVSLTIMTKKNKCYVKILAVWTFILLAFFVIIAIAVRSNVLGLFTNSNNLTFLITYCACAGGIGGTTFSFYELVSHLSMGDFDMNYFLWYISRPFLGLVYGTMIFLFIAGGLMTLSGTNAPLSDTLFTQKTEMFYIALSFLAGYAEEPVSLQLKALAEAIFKTPNREDKTKDNQSKKD